MSIGSKNSREYNLRSSACELRITEGAIFEYGDVTKHHPNRQANECHINFQIQSAPDSKAVPHAGVAREPKLRVESLLCVRQRRMDREMEESMIQKETLKQTDEGRNVVRKATNGACSLLMLQHENGPARQVDYHTLTEYRSEVAASTVAFRSVTEFSGGSLAPFMSSLLLHQTSYSFPRS
ncbi:hypothetical protein EVAR_28265_1 [Eumeta japonica]|uniref:Uncharacterized protein n=1 Tax=Eumeta variegata TaxID=151549 RepID=A0A4C1V5Q9_EUMVA|nr:hypothetical protein EVAR_28265_1 [Eumeta japonica]